MKRLIKIASTVLMAGAAASLAGCAGCSGCAGCNGETKNTTLTNSNWYTGTSYKGIQPSFIVDSENPDNQKEILVYDVNHAGDSDNSSYSAEYREGSFTTEFYAVNYDWKTNAQFPANPDDTDSVETLYYYRTELSIEVRFTMKTGANDSSEWFKDSVINESYFRAAGKNLQPVYSNQIIKSTSPSGYQASSLKNAYVSVDTAYENFYNRECTKVVSITKAAGKDESKKEFDNLHKVKNSFFDNAYLYTAVRSMKLSPNFSQNINLFSAAAGGISTYKISGSSSPLGNEDRKKATEALIKAELYTPVTQDSDGNTVEDAGINSVAMNINYAGGELSGTTQTVWYAALENADNNTARCTMLKISTPLSYNLGTLNYTLKTVESTLWNK